jgi:hypothetical protein
MPKFDRHLVNVMRSALEAAMTRVLSEYATSATKVFLAEYILEAAAQGQTRYDQFVTAATGQLEQTINLLFTEPHANRAHAPLRTFQR